MSEIRTSRATANRWRPFEDLNEIPVGHVALGDAASGQRVPTAAGGTHEVPWGIAVGFDFQLPATVADRPEPTPEATANAAYTEALGELATADIDAAEALFLWTHTFDTAQMRRPEIVGKVEAWIAAVRRPPYADPTQPPPPLDPR